MESHNFLENPHSRQLWIQNSQKKEKYDIIPDAVVRSVDLRCRRALLKHSDYRMQYGIFISFFFFVYNEIYRLELIHLICLRGFCSVSSLHRFLLFRSTYVMFRIPDTVYHKLLRCLDLVCILHRGLFQVFSGFVCILKPVMRSGAAAIPRIAAPRALA